MRSPLPAQAVESRSMRRPNPRYLAPSQPNPTGFTLVEILVATVLTLLMMLTVVTVFGNVSDSISGSRSLVDLNDQVRYTKDTLQRDLMGVTATMNPPRRPEQGEGYFEYIEGPVGAVILPLAMDVDRHERGVPVFDKNGDGDLDEDDLDSPQLDTTVGDYDDILMFTTRSLDEPFIGRFGDETIESRVAEVAWFLRGSTLYRRVLLVLPGAENQIPTDALTGTGTFAGRNFYENFDLSARIEGGDLDRRASSIAPRLRLNTLGDLTKRENRFAHQPFAFPHDARIWGDLGLPTLVECSSIFSDDAPVSRVFPVPLPYNPTNDANPMTGSVELDSHIYDDAFSKVIIPQLLQASLYEDVPDGTGEDTAKISLDVINVPLRDMWLEPRPWAETQADAGWPDSERQRLEGNLSGYQRSIRMDDVILTNVVSFDVKAWDPGAPVFLDEAGGVSVAVAPGDLAYRHAGTDRPFFTTTALNDFDALAANEQPIAFGAYVDLNYLGMSKASAVNIQYPPFSFPDSLPRSLFWGPGDTRSRLAGARTNVAPPSPADIPIAAAVYDTGSNHYEFDGFDQDDDGGVDEGADGFDSGGGGGVDDIGELEAPVPYAVPLRGIQVKIRVFDPNSQQVREVTVVQEFNAR